KALSPSTNQWRRLQFECERSSVEMEKIHDPLADGAPVAFGERRFHTAQLGGHFVLLGSERIRGVLAAFAQRRHAVRRRLTGYVLASLARAHFGSLLRVHVQTTP